jgi:hypothetical protein
MGSRSWDTSEGDGGFGSESRRSCWSPEASYAIGFFTAVFLYYHECLGAHVCAGLGVER